MLLGGVFKRTCEEHFQTVQFSSHDYDGDQVLSQWNVKWEVLECFPLCIKQIDFNFQDLIHRFHSIRASLRDGETISDFFATKVKLWKVKELDKCLMDDVLAEIRKRIQSYSIRLLES